MARTQSFDRDTVVRAARTLFWTVGYESASIPELETATGLSRSSIYNAFGSKRGLFDLDERMALLREVTAGYGNVVVDAFSGLLVDYCRTHDIPVIVKGLRAVSDFDYELQMAQMNRGLAGIDTLFMPTNPEYSFLASSLVKEIAKWGGDVSSLVPPNVLKRLRERTQERTQPG